MELKIKEQYKDRVVRARPNRFSLEEEKIVSELTKEEVRLGLVERVHTAWNSRLVLVPTSNGQWRKCGDYRQLNKYLQEYNYPLPRIDELLDKLGGRKYFSKMDFQRGFHQFPLTPESKEMTAFTTQDGKFAFNFLPFGVKIATEAFQEGMSDVVKELLWFYVFLYVDDLLAATKTRRAHLLVLRDLFRRLREVNLKLGRGK